MAEQPKVERLLRVMKLMSGAANYTVEELAGKVGTTYRTIYRYIDTFKEAGFVVERRYNNTYRLLRMPIGHADLKKLVYFSEEEAKIVAGLIESLNANNAFKANLYEKMAIIYDMTKIDDYTDRKSIVTNIETLSDAIENHVQVKLVAYSSANSNNIRDRIVEPYAFTKDHIDVCAYDVEDGKNKIFKIARIGGLVEPLGDWEYENEHEIKYVDVFRMVGSEQYPVKLELGLRAKSLLLEEFPAAKNDIKEEDGKFILDTMVTSMVGVGRFVIGLAADVKIIDTPLLVDYIKEYQKNIDFLVKQ